MLPENQDAKVNQAKGPGTAVAGKNGFSIQDLRSVFNGNVIAPGDPGYDQGRTTFYAGFDHRPAAILRPRNAQDVARAVLYAREYGMELSVRSGGHSVAGHSVSDGGLMLDLREMKGLDIDVQNRTAWAETGLTAGEVTNALAAHGLAVGFGDTASVGIGGITLGGGVGYLSRKYGLTIDSLLAAEVVTADGQILYTDDSTYADLFWAIRGGGGNFGVATRFKYRLYEVDKVFGGVLILPATPEVIEGVVDAAGAAPEELTGIFNVMPAPPMPFVPKEIYGQLIVMGVIVYAGPVEEGERVVAPFRALAEPIADLLKPMRYPEIYFDEGSEGEGEFHPTAAGLTVFLDDVDRQSAEQIVHYLESSDAPMRVAQIRVLGGAIARVPVEATAFANRKRNVMLGIYAFYMNAAERDVRQAWADELARKVQRGERGAYVNFLANEGEARLREAYPGSTWERLREIKARYDPTNLFRLNQNIPPAVNGSGG